MSVLIVGSLAVAKPAEVGGEGEAWPCNVEGPAGGEKFSIKLAFLDPGTGEGDRDPIERALPPDGLEKPLKEGAMDKLMGATTATLSVISPFAISSKDKEARTSAAESKTDGTEASIAFARGIGTCA